MNKDISKNDAAKIRKIANRFYAIASIPDDYDIEFDIHRAHRSDEIDIDVIAAARDRDFFRAIARIIH